MNRPVDFIPALFCLVLVGCETDAFRAELAVRKGEHLAEQEQTEAAIASFTQAIEIDPEYEEAYFSRAYVLYDLGEYERALEDYNRAVELDPDDAINFFNRAVLHEDLGNPQLAVEDYSASIRLDPTDPDGYNNRGVLLATLDKPEEGLADLNEAVRLSPEDPIVRVDRAQILTALERHEEAIQECDAALKLAADTVAAHFRRGIACYHLGRWDDAIRDLSEVLDSDEDEFDEEAILYRAMSLAGKGEHLAAIIDFDDAIRRNPQNAKAYELRAAAHRQAGNARQAEEDAATAKRLHESGDDIKETDGAEPVVGIAAFASRRLRVFRYCRLPNSLSELGLSFDGTGLAGRIGTISTGFRPSYAKFGPQVLTLHVACL